MLKKLALLVTALCSGRAKPQARPAVAARDHIIRTADQCNTSSSAFVAKVMRGSHVLKIDGYSTTKGLFETGKCVRSESFSVGGYNWFIKYYPNGSKKEYDDSISVFLYLDSDVAKDVNVKFSLHLLDKDGIRVPSHSCNVPLHTFSSKGSNWGFLGFIMKEVLESSVHLRDDCFSIQCDVTVMKEVHSEQSCRREQFVVVPPSNLHQHLGDLLEKMDGTDVTFKVKGETFSAHRYLLAARSPVFKSELFGSMKERACADMPIEIDDMECDVFKSLLHYIYTDSLPDITQEGSDGTCASVVMAQHLLVAADRYNIERLKLLCEEKLCKHMDSSMVATSLALAEQHSCNGLKEACFAFLASPSNLMAMMISDGYDHLKISCPSVLKELISKLLPAELEAAKEIVMTI